MRGKNDQDESEDVEPYHMNEEVENPAFGTIRRWAVKMEKWINFFVISLFFILFQSKAFIGGGFVESIVKIWFNDFYWKLQGNGQMNIFWYKKIDLDTWIFGWPIKTTVSGEKSKSIDK